MTSHYMFVFNSGIRIITIRATSLEEAKQKLTIFEPTAWTDKTWNWKITKGASPC